MRRAFRRLGHADIVVIMRERTPFPARLFARLPRLQLLVTTGMRNLSIDLAAAEDVVVCGTAGSSVPPMELTWALILGLARHLVPGEHRVARERPVAEHDRHRPARSPDQQGAQNQSTRWSFRHSGLKGSE